MGYGIRLKVWGGSACFTRPEMKAERVSYDVMTPSAARAILEAVYWKPSIRWVIDRIDVLNPIEFGNIRRNEIMNKIPAGLAQSLMSGKRSEIAQYATDERQQRATLLLRNVAYVIHAHFVMVKGVQTDEAPEKHYNLFLRRARGGQCFNQPYFGCREFNADFQLLESNDPTEISCYATVPEKDLGWMLWDIDFSDDMNPLFFRAVMKHGSIEIPDLFQGRR